VRVGLLSLTLLAEVEVRTHTALVSDSLNGRDTASITSHSLMHLHGLVCSLLAKIVNHQSLESLSSVGLHIIFHNLEQFGVEG